MKYHVRWTDGNGKSWYVKKPLGQSAVLRKLRTIMHNYPKRRKHAVLITINASQEA